jgi:DNA-binding winged helix-turn-helix (wHTH) protein
MTTHFGSFALDSARRQVSREGHNLHLTPKAFDLLSLLVEAAPRVVTKAEIHQRLWPAGVVTDATLVGLVKEIRRTLNDTSEDSPIIRTAHRVGYAIDPPVTHSSGDLSHRHWLVVANRRIALGEGENIIGRDPAANVWLDNSTVSRRHARMTVLSTRTILEDLGSKNGTSVGGVPLTDQVVLRSGDEFACGEILMTYRHSIAAMPTATLASPIDGPHARR